MDYTAQQDLARYIAVCDALPAHIDGTKLLADANRDIFGFIVRVALEDASRQQCLLVAVTGEGEVVGFLRYHHRKRDLITTLYDICVAEQLRGNGIGSQLVRALSERCRSRRRAAIQLKCPAHLRANQFYARWGFARVATMPGKRHDINLWQLGLESMDQA